MMPYGGSPSALGFGESPSDSAPKLLDVRDLATKFFTVDGVVNALNGISYSVDRGGPPPTRNVPGQPFSKAPPIPQGGIIGLFPEPGGSR